MISLYNFMKTSLLKSNAIWEVKQTRWIRIYHKTWIFISKAKVIFQGFYPVVCIFRWNYQHCKIEMSVNLATAQGWIFGKNQFRRFLVCICSTKLCTLIMKKTGLIYFCIKSKMSHQSITLSSLHTAKIFERYH